MNITKCSLLVLNFLRFGVINAKSFDRYSLHFLLLKGAVIIIAACCCDGIYNLDTLCKLAECGIFTVQMG